ncbi:glycosyltransferase family 4 protein [Enhydrobacter aerosaccus]|uniref:glycosyltransferase family 4 protein n=1 Tax=Enhydrobacter aerosaccus TaxID=225324 RepID=UPI001483C0C3|nr:glycosyltransferase family 4 protein [Enhydrobacter aerosaccus]
MLTDGYGAQGGIARYNQDLFDSLAEGGAQSVILPRHGDAGAIALPPGIRQERAAFGRLRYVVNSLVAALRLGPFDVVFCGHLYMAPLAWMLARLLRARLWVQAHGVEVEDAPGGLTRTAIEAADLVTVVSRATRHTLLSWANLIPERVRVLPDTVRDMFVPGPRSETLRARFGLGAGPILLTVGRLAASERYKGHEQIFAILPALRLKFPTLVHVVAGDGDDRARLEARAIELSGDRTAVRFLGYVPEADLPDLYRSADLYVMPSTKEGFGIVYLEAAGCGLRVVGGVGGGSADAVSGEQIGVLVDPADGTALEAAILRLLAMGRTTPDAVAPYRRDRFAAAANLLLARLMAHPRRMKGAA